MTNPLSGIRKRSGDRRAKSDRREQDLPFAGEDRRSVERLDF